MTVAELIAELQQCPPDSIVICQKDSEGNGYSPLVGADGTCTYVAECTWAGDVYSSLDREKDEDLPEGVPCVVLFPVN